MASTASKHKTRSDKFPLTLHRTGQFCKKIRGRIYYFGTDKREALQRYLEQAAFLHAGKAVRPTLSGDKMSAKTLCNSYLQHQDTRVSAGEIKARQLYDQTSLLRSFIKFIGPHREVSNIATIDLQNYRAKLIREKKSPTTINNHTGTIKAMYHWAADNEIIISIPNLKAIKKIKPIKSTRPIFASEQVHELLDCADTQMKAMIWLGLNCGFGCTDCAELLWANVDLNEGRINFPRGKTGIDRNLPLWPETIAALKALMKQNTRVFNTANGNPWVRTIETVPSNGGLKRTKDNALSKSFAKLLKKAGITTEKGVGFYTLRRTAATWAARSGDPFAVQKLLGHADLKMASTYVQDVSEQTDRAINNSRKFIVQDSS
jgi:integrase